MSKFLVYKSSAGSGKTSTLIEIFLKLSLNSKDARHFKKLLAITFTNKAAGEMKDRFIEELNNLRNMELPYTGSNHIVHNLLESLSIQPNRGTGMVLNQPPDEPGAEDLAERARRMLDVVLHDYSDLSISTIDRFNHRLIRSFSQDLGLKADFEVEMETGLLFEDAVDRLLEKVGVDGRITKHLLGYLELKVDDEKGVRIREDLKKMKNLVMDESAVDAIESLKSDEDLDFFKIREELYQTQNSARETIRRKAKETIKIFDTTGIEAKDVRGGNTGSIWGFAERLRIFPDGKITDTMDKNVRYGLNGDFVLDSAPKHLKARVYAVTHQLTAALKDLDDTWKAHREIFYLSRGLLQQIDLVAVLEELSRCLDEICEERNILPISNFNRLISEALRKESVAYLYENYGVRFDHVLIDEFQDTSELQWFNVLPLIEESVAKGKVSMVVGDAKQSIYRWRGGKAEQLINLPKIEDAPEDLAYTASQISEETCIADPLNTNYRTRENIVNFNNALFSAMGTQLTQNESSYRTEYAKDNVSQQTTSRNGGGYVRIEYIREKKLDGQPLGEFPKWNLLLENIERFRKQGYPYSDMAVLVRSSDKEGRKIIDYLRKYDIPISTGESFEVNKDPEVQLILSLMRLTIEPHNENEKISVMRCMQSLRNLEFAPHKYVEYKHINLYKYLRDNDLPLFKPTREGEGIYDMANRFMNTYLSHSHNHFLTAFLNVIVGRVGMNGTCTQFFEWWDTLREKPGVPGSSSQNAIYLTTIHKAKGLEFPIVLIPDLNWKKRASHTELKWFDLREKPLSPLKFSPLAISSTLIDMGLEREREIEEEENDFDNLNLVYVALTRPVHALCIAFEKPAADRISHPLLFALEAMKIHALPKMPNYRADDEFEWLETIEIGEIPAYQKPKDTESSTDFIPVFEKDNRPWYSKILASPPTENPEQVRGIRFHKIVSQAANRDEARKLLDKWLDTGGVELMEHAELLEMVEALYIDSRFAALLKTAKPMAERELFYNGKIMRPDLVFENKNEVVLLDFKTGEHKTSYEKQVRRYGLALRQMTTKSVNAFLVYVLPVQWVEVPLESEENT